jgi:hypothetical protein
MGQKQLRTLTRKNLELQGTSRSWSWFCQSEILESGSVFFVVGKHWWTGLAKHEENVAGVQNFGPVNPTLPSWTSPLCFLCVRQTLQTALAEHEENGAGKYETVKLGLPERNSGIRLRLLRVRQTLTNGARRTRRKRSREVWDNQAGFAGLKFRNPAPFSSCSANTDERGSPNTKKT